MRMRVPSLRTSPHFIILAVASTCILVAAQGRKWNMKCTPPCTCDMSYFSDLPMATQWMNQETTAKQPHNNQNNNNEATYEDQEQSRGDLLKIAMCVLQEGMEPQSVTESLPKDIQVLTVLQGRGYKGTSLEANLFQDFQDLMVVDIQGLEQDDSKPTDHLVLCNDVLQPLISLRYLNLQNIKLLGHIRQDNRVHPLAFTQPIGPVPRTTRKGRREKDAVKRRIVFLQPTDNDIPLVSYEEYKEEIVRAGLATFTGLSELVSLRVYACDLREVNWEMFKGLGKLQHLSLERNNLLFIPEFAFYGTPHLKTLSLAGNKLLSLQDTALAGLLELNKLDLSSNKFSHLSELSLPPFPELRTADFRNNPVEAIFPSTFEIMNATYDLYLGDNDSPLNLLPNSFLGLSSLQKLHVSNAKVPLLERELLRGMPRLQKLVMTGNIHSISFDAFLEVPKLEHLILNNCSISSISMDAFYGLYGLISLDLSHNLLMWLPPGVFDQQFSLKELLLNNNKLTELPPSIFTRVPAKMIRLEQNPWHCSCAMSEWQPSAINKVKQRAVKPDGLCQFGYDKGSDCKGVVADRYVYDKRVSPRCATPQKYSNWNVFHLLRKELHCNKKQKKDKKTYLKKKQEDYEQSINPQHVLNKYRAIEQILEGNVNDRENGTVNYSDSKPNNNSVSLTPNQAIEANDSSLVDSNLHVSDSNTTTKVYDIKQTDVTPMHKYNVGTTTEEEHDNNEMRHVNTTQDEVNPKPAQDVSKVVGNTKSTNISSITVTSTSHLNKVNTKMATTDRITRGESYASKKAKQQLAMQREKEERAIWKEKIKANMTNGVVGEGLTQDKELKNALKLDMEKKRMEKLKQVIS